MRKNSSFNGFPQEFAMALELLKSKPVFYHDKTTHLKIFLREIKGVINPQISFPDYHDALFFEAEDLTKSFNASLNDLTYVVRLDSFFEEKTKLFFAIELTSKNELNLSNLPLILLNYLSKRVADDWNKKIDSLNEINSGFFGVLDSSVNSSVNLNEFEKMFFLIEKNRVVLLFEFPLKERKSSGYFED